MKVLISLVFVISGNKKSCIPRVKIAAGSCALTRSKNKNKK